jgi:prepilin-type N-terminal cleavage/methylation domain-containing protein
MQRNGFSLIEFSAVLVIIALLTGAIVSTNKLIRQAKLSSLVSEVINIRANYHKFNEKYGELPGDMSVAYNYFGDPCDTTESNCNGDGDGEIDYGTGTVNEEALRAWQHLYLAGFSIFNASGTAVSGGVTVIDTNVPKSAYGDSGYTLNYISSTIENAISFGRQGAKFTNGAVLTAADANIIDHKYDDGVSNLGDIIGGDVSGAVSVCSTGGVYSIAVTQVICYMQFVMDN